MKNKLSSNIEKCRITNGLMKSDSSLGMNGAFEITYAKTKLFIVASDGADWDHVSVSLRHRQPTWDEMQFIKRCFFKDDETVIQIHPPQDRYVNFHPNVLHLWRCQNQEIKLPPTWMIAPK